MKLEDLPVIRVDSVHHWMGKSTVPAAYAGTGPFKIYASDIALLSRDYDVLITHSEQTGETEKLVIWLDFKGKKMRQR